MLATLRKRLFTPPPPPPAPRAHDEPEEHPGFDPAVKASEQKGQALIDREQALMRFIARGDAVFRNGRPTSAEDKAQELLATGEIPELTRADGTTPTGDLDKIDVERHFAAIDWSALREELRIIRIALDKWRTIEHSRVVRDWRQRRENWLHGSEAIRANRRRQRELAGELLDLIRAECGAFASCVSQGGADFRIGELTTMHKLEDAVRTLATRRA